MGSSGVNQSALFASMMAAATRTAAGKADVPTLGATASTTISVEIKPPMPDTGYSASAFITTASIGGLNLLGTLEVQQTTVVDASHVSVKVKNTGLLQLAGAIVNVLAVKT